MPPGFCPIATDSRRRRETPETFREFLAAARPALRRLRQHQCAISRHQTRLPGSSASRVPPGCGVQKKYDQASNDQYMKGLLNLQQCVQQTADAPPDQKEATKSTCLQTATQAHLAAAQIAQGLPNDTEGHVDATVGALLEEPIKDLQRLWASGGGSSEGLCKPYKILQSLYPFNARSSHEATLRTVQRVLPARQRSALAISRVSQKALSPWQAPPMSAP